MTLKELYIKYDKGINKAIEAALREDNIYNDITTNLFFKGKKSDRKISALLLCKESCILAGLEIFKKVFKKIDRDVHFKNYHKDGDRLRNKDKVLEVKSSLKNLLLGERTALNFLQRMSGIATLTNEFVKKMKFKGAKILHTRKTTPNFRIFEVAAVKIGGGDIHRLSLNSAVMIKDNHIKSVGTVYDVFDKLEAKGITKRLKKKFEIEDKSLNEVEVVAERGKNWVEVVMLDNFKPRDIDNAVNILKKSGIRIEVSGGINMQNFPGFQRKGIDYYSIGMLTHSYKSVDFSLEF